GALTLIADTSGPLSDFGLLSINDAGLVAFRAALDAGGQGVYVGNGGPLSTIVSASDGTGFGPHVSINNSGLVAFGKGAATTQGAYVSDGSTTTTIADSSGPLNVPTCCPFLSDNGTASFAASFDSGGGRVSTGSGLLAVTREALNDSGQVAFQATLTNGVQGVFRADPLN